jgi:hypothetical protein
LLLAACTSPEESGVRVIVGAKLEPGPGRAPVDYSVVVIADGKFRAVGPQSSTPVPKGSQITRGLGKIVQPAPGGDPIEPGRPANLVLRDSSTGSIEASMRNGEWVR